MDARGNASDIPVASHPGQVRPGHFYARRRLSDNWFRGQFREFNRRPRLRVSAPPVVSATRQIFNFSKKDYFQHVTIKLAFMYTDYSEDPMQPKLVSPNVRKCGTKYFSLYACGFCGKEFQASLAQLKRIANLSCGCTKLNVGCPPARQWLPHMPGDVVEHGHRVVALKTSGHGSGKKNLYECAHCGGRFEETKGNVRRTRLSCGCIKKPGPKTHGHSGERLYTTWTHMNQRCTPGKSAAKNYGDRGIRICDEWKTYEPFRDWAQANGYSDTLTIDRIDVNGNYEPSNCRWATKAQQARNTRNTVFNERIVMVMRRLFKAGMTPSEIGILWGMSGDRGRSAVRSIVMGETWSSTRVEKPKFEVDPLSILTRNLDWYNPPPV